MSMTRNAGIILPGYNPLLVANAPTIGTATAGGSNCASVTFTAPSCTGGSVISTYTVFCTTTGTNVTTGASSPLVVTGLTNGSSYTFKVVATNIYGQSYPSSASNSITATLAGAQAYTTPGNYSWVAPAGVTSVSVVAIGNGGRGGLFNCCCGQAGAGGGGGGLGYKNNYSVTPGSSYSVRVGSATSCQGSFFVSTGVLYGQAGGTGSQANNPGCGGIYVGDGGGVGGTGGWGGSSKGGGGGGAGGYSGAGGNGGRYYPGGGTGGTNGSGGGGGGGAGATCYGRGGNGGGGVGIYGQGSNGTGAGFSQCVAATGGSSGCSGGVAVPPAGAAGGSYGGGGGGGSQYGSRGAGAGGAVRIVWPGNTRTFPSTNVGP